MPGRIRLRLVSFAAVVAMLGAGCTASSPSGSQPAATAAPTTSGPSPEPTRALATAAPIPAASSGIGRRWERLEAASPHDSIHDAVFGSAGWVAVGDCYGKACAPPLAAAAWSSPDGRTWTRAQVDGPADATIEQVTWNGSAYFAAGVRHARPGDGRVPVWRSSDGRRWDHLGTIDRGACGTSDCAAAGPLAVTAAGQLVLGWVDAADDGTSGTYWSADGRAWERLDLPAFVQDEGSPAVVDVVATASGLVLLGQCVTCQAVAAWTSGDGRTWERTAELDATASTEVSLTSSGTSMLAALTSCAVDACAADIWGTADGRDWIRLATGERLGRHMAFAGHEYVAVDYRPEQGTVATSSDGRSWTEFVPDDGLSFGDDCAIAWVAGNADTLLLGDPDCSGIWFSPVARS
jgi:hypothetical protein